MNLAEWLQEESDALDRMDDLMYQRAINSIQPDENGMCTITFPAPPKWMVDLYGAKDLQ